MYIFILFLIRGGYNAYKYSEGYFKFNPVLRILYKGYLLYPLLKRARKIKLLKVFPENFDIIIALELRDDFEKE